ncbi:serine/threonine-protein kinase PRP4 homolog isoform X2 [Lingula anatina]|uniref:Serine/threonine-protein kinase PRP4 homolog isoform X2 n=1 Tax=Lingula anatina TaxID=7574 RepID=A0A1S3K0Y2_LINAN|nr:serine/threonine-protein kinase PRP4 homolog isoform X2 [Lingula anatina]|eukprot:XP_013416187.1 serine/threonine-protein kinase PRP4 homolog isoform X2 [Lingula anatina]
MAESSVSLSPRVENNQNIFDIIQKENVTAKENDAPEVDTSNKPATVVENKLSNAARDPKSFRNLPGQQCHFSTKDENKPDESMDEDTSSPEKGEVTPQRHSSTENQSSTGCSEPKTESPVTPDMGKRKRTHHDYRRLSSSGYVDDTEGKEKFRPTSCSESELSPTPPKVMPLKIKLPRADSLVNGVPGDPVSETCSIKTSESSPHDENTTAPREKSHKKKHHKEHKSHKHKHKAKEKRHHHHKHHKEKRERNSEESPGGSTVAATAPVVTPGVAESLQVSGSTETVVDKISNAFDLIEPKVKLDKTPSKKIVKTDPNVISQTPVIVKTGHKDSHKVKTSQTDIKKSTEGSEKAAGKMPSLTHKEGKSGNGQSKSHGEPSGKITQSSGKGTDHSLNSSHTSANKTSHTVKRSNSTESAKKANNTEVSKSSDLAKKLTIREEKGAKSTETLKVASKGETISSSSDCKSKSHTSSSKSGKLFTGDKMIAKSSPSKSNSSSHSNSSHHSVNKEKKKEKSKTDSAHQRDKTAGSGSKPEKHQPVDSSVVKEKDASSHQLQTVKIEKDKTKTVPLTSKKDSNAVKVSQNKDQSHKVNKDGGHGIKKDDGQGVSKDGQHRVNKDSEHRVKKVGDKDLTKSQSRDGSQMEEKVALKRPLDKTVKGSDSSPHKIRKVEHTTPEKSHKSGSSSSVTSSTKKPDKTKHSGGAKSEKDHSLSKGGSAISSDSKKDHHQKTPKSNNKDSGGLQRTASKMQLDAIRASYQAKLLELSDSKIASQPDTFRDVDIVIKKSDLSSKYKYGHLMHVEVHTNGGAKVIHCYQEELDCLTAEQSEEFAQEFFTEAYGEEPYGTAKYVMAIVHRAASYLPDLLEHFAFLYPQLVVKAGILGKSDIETTTMESFVEKVRQSYSYGTFRSGSLLQLSLVGTVTEEAGDYFPDFLDMLEHNPFLRKSMPWGDLSVVHGLPRNRSNDGPILWARPGEQMVPSADMPKSPFKRKRGMNELKNLALLPRVSEPRENLIEEYNLF